MVYAVAKLFPHQTNIQGDAENANALVSQLEWMGLPTELVTVHQHHADLPDVRLMVLGHVVESQYSEVIRALEDLRPWLLRQFALGSVMLAVGSALEMLVTLGFLTGRVVPAPTHIADDAVVLGSFDRALWGFENSGHTYERGPGEAALGTLVRGRGNGDGTEGVVARVGSSHDERGTVVGTHLHGPVVVRNPSLAKFLFELALPDKVRVSELWDAQPTLLAHAIELANELWNDRRNALDAV